jgi:hypothetical protein
MQIANIITNNKQDLLFNKVIPEYVNIVDYSNINSTNINKPTLYIGYSDIIKNNILTLEGEQIFNNQVDNNTWWTYSKQERLSSFHDVVDMFCLNSPKFYFYNTDRFVYKPFHYLFDTVNDFNIANIIKVYANKRSIFCLMNDNKTIYGFDKNYFYYINKLDIIKDILSLQCVYEDNEYVLLKQYQQTMPCMYETIEKYLVTLIIYLR